MKPKPDTLQSIMRDLLLCHTPEIKKNQPPPSEPPFLCLQNLGKNELVFLFSSCELKKKKKKAVFAMFLPRHAEPPSSSWCWRGAAGVASAGRLWCVGQLRSPEGCCRRFSCLGRPSGAVPGRAGGVPHRSRSPGTRSPRLAREESAARHPCQPHLVENTFPPLQLAGWNEPGTAGETSLAGH